MSEDWHQTLRDQRAAKDEYLREHPHSPLPPDVRTDFEGLEYYEPDPDLRYELDLDEHETKQTVTVSTTTGGETDYLRWGEFTFTEDGEILTLQAYKAEPDEPRLWVPFRDATSGEETYGAGRYLDLEDPEDRTDDGQWVLDFNEAYNPFCAYSEAYECPFIPTENWLEVPIRAGEKDFGHPAAEAP